MSKPDWLNVPYTRRGFLMRGGIVSSGLLIGSGYVVHLHRSAYFETLKVTSYRLASARWPADLLPIKIAFLSDLHVGCMSVPLEKVDAIVAQVNALQPDLILLGGDFVVGGRAKTDPRYIKPSAIAEKLKKLKAPLGVISVLGNHDWRHDGEEIRTALQENSITVLENDFVHIPYGKKGFYVAGLADYMTRQPAYKDTIDAMPSDYPIVVLSHDPYTFKDMPSGVLVQLSGHTHGGQVSLPLVGPITNPTPGAPLKWLYGLIEDGNKHMIVTSGVGTSVLPIKNTPCEVVLLTIETGATLAS